MPNKNLYISDTEAFQPRCCTSSLPSLSLSRCENVRRSVDHPGREPAEIAGPDSAGRRRRFDRRRGPGPGRFKSLLGSLRHLIARYSKALRSPTHPRRRRRLLQPHPTRPRPSLPISFRLPLCHRRSTKRYLYRSTCIHFEIAWHV